MQPDIEWQMNIKLMDAPGKNEGCLPFEADKTGKMNEERNELSLMKLST